MSLTPLAEKGYNRHIFGPLAQLAEQLTLNQRVSGSSPEWVIRFGPGWF